METHMLRDLGLGLQLPGWKLNPQGKERCSAREKKQPAAPRGSSQDLAE